MKANIIESSKKRIVIVGGGFGGLQIARDLADSNYQIVLIDKNNYHQFQPLFYQVATAGLEPSTIAFPFRKIFQHKKNVHIRVAEVHKVNPEINQLETSIGVVDYHYLVIAIGADTNFFGNQKMMDLAYPMKSVSEALTLRNTLLQNYENAISETDREKRKGIMNVVVVGGGATGVEVSGTLAEMKKCILPKDFPELDFKQMQVYLLEGSPRVLNGFSDNASSKAHKYLEELGVNVFVNSRVKDYDGENVFLEGGKAIPAKTLVWAAGIAGNKIEGLKPEVIARANRIKVDRKNLVEGYQNIFAIGDIAYMTEANFQNGHPQVAQVAIQQAKNLSKNFKNLDANKALVDFSYKDLGSMATVGRNKAVADLPKWKFAGFFAWLIWMFIHLMSIVGGKNRLFAFINWAWSYITFDQSLRLIMKPKERKRI
ncbi:MAG: NAD(P)/FAD-dependent oxidoreductase [Bacteroidota bacterium]|jgi:NADH dehydrogenase|nr:NAD(P)/FAD-dependent oxidoreductase [Bacteroidota bacterium]